MKTILTTIAVLGIGTAAVAQPQPQGQVQGQPQPGMARGPDFMMRAAAEERATQLSRMLDANRDGTVSRAEVDAWATSKSVPPAMVEAMFGDADTNRDGKITLAEQKADALRSFDEADTDHDGRMTGAERAAAEAKYSAEPGAAATPAPLPVPVRKR